MSKFIKIGGGLFLGVLLVIQFFRGTYPETVDENTSDLQTVSEVSSGIGQILNSACYDCHSMETNYPWYSKMAPVSWLIIDHIKEGREELNFSKWGEYPKRTKIRKLKDIAEEIEEHKMPLESYTLLHSEAKLSDKQREILVNWADEMSKTILSE